MEVEVNIQLAKKVEVPITLDPNLDIDEQISEFEVEELARKLIEIPIGWEEVDFFVDY
jgi:hypothetical protein